tara:strand:- start:758 stop:1036 length:279 start_codon:yes stop_codon:yes gene_type:complete
VINMSLANDLLAKVKATVKPPKKKKHQKTTNHHGVVFRFNDGAATTADKLGEHYGVSTYYVKKIYTENKKDYLISNKAIVDWKEAKNPCNAR